MSETRVNEVEQIALLGIAKRARIARDNNLPLEVSPSELLMLHKYADAPDGLEWENALREAFSDALPHISVWPWEPPGVAAFGSLPVVVRALIPKEET